MYAATVAHRAASGGLEIAQPFLSRAQYLALQAAQHLPAVSQNMARLLLNLSGDLSKGPVDLVCVHAGLSLEV